MYFQPRVDSTIDYWKSDALQYEMHREDDLDLFYAQYYSGSHSPPGVTHVKMSIVDLHGISFGFCYNL